MRKLQAAMFAAPFALILNNAIAENAKPDQEKAQAQTDAVERKIGRGQGTDWTGHRVETQADDARGAPSSGNAELAMTCQGKTGREKDKCLGFAQGDEDKAGAAAKEKQDSYKR